MTNTQLSAPPDLAETDPCLLEVRGITKTFGPIRANQDVTFSVRAGEVHCLLGENGAGKSTLVKSLYGVHQPDSGELRLDGDRTVLGSPAEARKLGIGMVFQDMRLIPAFTVWENVALYLKDSRLVLKPAELRRRIDQASQRYGLAVDPDRRVSTLSIGEWQRVELLKVLLDGVRVLVLDEPTSVLTPQEVDGLFEVIQRLRAEDVGVILITHKLREVRAIADRVTVLRGGRTVTRDANPADLTDEQLVTAMVGEPVATTRRSGTEIDRSATLISLRGVTARFPDGGKGIRDISLDVHPGEEVLGVAGVAGSGQNELTDVLTGNLRPAGGTIHRDGEGYPAAPGAARRSGVVEVCPDPVTQFVVPGLAVSDHVTLWNSRGTGRFDQRASHPDLTARDDSAELHVAAPGRRLDSLSGGNIQRVVLTLALTEPGDASALICASYPTRGLDILTTERTRTLLRERADAGAAVVLVSEDLEELMAISDRIAVLHDGELSGVVDAGTTGRAELGALMTGDAA
ncbi:MAG: ABC transporter ATP-binding protein [Arachnia sp.]